MFGDVAVVASSAAWVEKYKQEIEAFINKVDGISHINWRPSVDILKEEGLDLLQLKHASVASPSQVEVFTSLKEGITERNNLLFLCIICLTWRKVV